MVYTLEPRDLSMLVTDKVAIISYCFDQTGVKSLEIRMLLVLNATDDATSQVIFGAQRSTHAQNGCAIIDTENILEKDYVSFCISVQNEFYMCSEVQCIYVQ